MAVQLSELVKYVQQARDARSPLDIKFSDGQTRTIHMDGSWIGAPIAGMPDPTGNRSINSTIDNFISQQQAAAQPTPQPTVTPIAQVAPQASTPAPVKPPLPVQPTTPVAQVSPQAAAAVPFALKGGNASLFSNIDPKTGLPIIKQSVIDAELNKTKQNVLTANNSNIRDAIYGSGWNAKSDAVKVLHGAAIYGLNKAPAGMSGMAWQSLSGKALTDQDFINAAKAAGIDPTPYYSKQQISMGPPRNVLNRDALYNAINDKSKDLYSITNTIDDGARGTATPHATILFKSDGQGNLVAAANPTTGQPAVQYSSATRYANDPGFLSDFGPLLGMAGLAFGLPALMESFGPGVIGTNLGGAAADASLGFTAAQVAPTSALANAAGIGGGFTGAAPLTAALAADQIAGGGLTAQQLQDLYGVSNVLTPDQLSAAQTALENALGTTGGVTAANLPALNAAATAAGINTLTGGLGSTLSSLATGAGGTAAQQALAKAFENNALYNLLGSGAGALASYLGASGQSDAAKQAAANQLAMFNTINKQLAPQRGAGYSALNQIRSMLPGQYTTYGETGQPTGTAQGTDYLTRQFTPQDLYAGLAPNYQFMLGQGQQAQQRAANLSGGLIGGNALRGLEDYTQNYAQNAYQNAFQNFQNQRTGIYNTLAGIAGIGQNATDTSAKANQAATTAAGQLGVGSAAAQAAGLTGVANAATGGLQNYQQNQILQAILAQKQDVANTQTNPYV